MIRTRFHGTYAEYLAMQASKATLPETREKLLPKRVERVAWFRDRFAVFTGRHCKAVCLGARYGEEVEALRLIGWEASGIDLAAFPPWVETGDMNQPLTEAVDLIYTNAFDHCWVPGQFAENIVAALKPGGAFMLHVSSGPVGAFETVEWDSVQDVAGLFQRDTTFQVMGTVPEFYGLDTEIVGVVL